MASLGSPHEPVRAHFGSAVMADQSPECTPKRTSVDVADLKITPDGLDLVCSRLSIPIAKNILVPFFPKSPACPRPSRPTKGRIAIVTDAGRDAVDAGCVRRAMGSQGGLLSVSAPGHAGRRRSSGRGRA